MTGRTRQFLNGDQRQEYGCVVSFENAAGKRLVLHRKGKPLGLALLETLEEALGHDRSFRVVCYSTPQTILGDPTGARDPWQQTATSYTSGHLLAMNPATLPEALALGRIGCLAMLHPRLSFVAQSRERTRQAERDPLEAVRSARERVS